MFSAIARVAYSCVTWAPAGRLGLIGSPEPLVYASHSTDGLRYRWSARATRQLVQ
jgi:hypothetical protein